MPFRYTFSSHTITEYRDVLLVRENNTLVSSIPLHSKIVRNFAFDQLVNWLGRDNAANILVRGEEVTLTREQPILFDFSRFKP